MQSNSASYKFWVKTSKNEDSRISFQDIIEKLKKGKGNEVSKYLSPDSFKEEYLNTLPDGKTLLHEAAFYDSNVDVVKALLNSYIFMDQYSVDVTDNRGFTPLHIAAIRGCTQIAMLLLDYGADRWKRAPKSDNQDSIQLASSSRYFELSEMIKKRAFGDYIDRYDTPPTSTNNTDTSLSKVLWDFVGSFGFCSKRDNYKNLDTHQKQD